MNLMDLIKRSTELSSQRAFFEKKLALVLFFLKMISRRAFSYREFAYYELSF